MASTRWLYSIVLIYSVNKREAVGKSAIEATTANGTLEAWLLRHPAVADYENPKRGVWLDEWAAFPAGTPTDRRSRPTAFQLVGKIKLTYSSDGIVKEGKIDLENANPLPKYVEFLAIESQKSNVLVRAHPA